MSSLVTTPESTPEPALGSAPGPNTAGLRADAAIISLVGFAHGSSHFFHLVFPSLFPWLIAEFGLGFAAVGKLMTVFFVVSGIGQALAGIWVDRFGAFRVLCAGLGLLTLSGMLIFVAPGMPALYAAAIVAGLGNSVFHPADFALINRRVSTSRLGHAFSVHGLSGNLGWAIAPLYITAIAQQFGWRAAGLGAAAFGLAALLVIFYNRKLLRYDIQTIHLGKTSVAAPPTPLWAFLRLRMVWLAFAFFLFSTFGFGALQNFAPVLLAELYGLSMASATSSLSVYLIGGSIGLLVGGFLVKERSKGNRSFEFVIAGALLSGVFFAFMLATGALSAWLVIPIMGAMGFGVGLAGPSRDALVRTAAKARLGDGAFGRVYGLVYSGLDVGLAIAPIAFGMLLDRHMPNAVFAGVGLTLACAILAALALGRESRVASLLHDKS
jgi:MFS transporter, FSR family, fosmidomycin resistance protein